MVESYGRFSRCECTAFKSPLGDLILLIFGTCREEAHLIELIHNREEANASTTRYVFRLLRAPKIRHVSLTDVAELTPGEYLKRPYPAFVKPLSGPRDEIQVNNPAENEFGQARP